MHLGDLGSEEGCIKACKLAEGNGVTMRSDGSTEECWCEIAQTGTIKWDAYKNCVFQNVSGLIGIQSLKSKLYYFV